MAFGHESTGGHARVSEVRTELGAAVKPRKLGLVSPSVLALCRIKPQPEGVGAGSLGQVGRSVAGPALRALRNSETGLLSFQMSRRDAQKE